jgi:hypothetical protein
MSDTPYPYNEAQELWLRDLETTEEPQTKGRLHRILPSDDKEPGYCCLGRACVVLGLTPDDVSPFPCSGSYRGRTGGLPEFAFKRLRLRDDGGELLQPFVKEGRKMHSLYRLNDTGWSFKQIATYIRANPYNVFLPPEESSE